MQRTITTYREGYHLYWRLVIATGHREEVTTTFPMIYSDFLKTLNKWNAQQPGVYQYWQTTTQRTEYAS